MTTPVDNASGVEIGRRSEALGGPGDLEATLLQRAPRHLYLDGQWREAEDGRLLTVEDPSTGAELCAIANAGEADAAAAIDAAARSQAEWSDEPPAARAELLWRAYELLRVHTHELAVVLTLEMGKPISESRGEIEYAADFFRWFSGEAERVAGDYRAAPNGASRMLVMRQPVGPSYLITPWNFPMAMGARKLAPALAAGCTVVWKPAQQTPLSALALAELLERAGLPAGVLNVIPSSDAAAVSAPIIGDSRLRKLSFTGSTGVGRRLIAQAADSVLNVSMELGGNAPFLVFEDADLDAAVSGAIQAKMRNGGEACTAANRFLLHEEVADEFATRLARRLGGLRVGRGIEPGTELGPLIDAVQQEKVAELVDDALAAGARRLGRADRVSDGPGYFYPPTVLVDVPATARLLREEIFGPVAPITTFSSEAEAIEGANPIATPPV